MSFLMRSYSYWWRLLVALFECWWEQTCPDLASGCHGEGNSSRFKRVDYYGGYPPILHGQFGFAAIRKMPYDGDKGPPGWKDSPDAPEWVVFMALTKDVGDERQIKARATGAREKWLEESATGNVVDDYDGAKEDSRGAVSHRLRSQK